MLHLHSSENLRLGQHITGALRWCVTQHQQDGIYRNFTRPNVGARLNEWLPWWYMGCVVLGTVERRHPLEKILALDWGAPCCAKMLIPILPLVGSPTQIR